MDRVKEKHPWRRLSALCVIVSLFAALLIASPAPDADAQTLSAEQINQNLGIGLNFGSTLERQREGIEGLTLRESDFTAIADAGFGHVRVPILFTAYAADTAPFEIPEGIDPTVPNADNLWERLDWVIENAERNGLYVILDVHGFDEVSADYLGERDRFLSIWQQIAERYAGASSRVLFELLNEPHGEFIDDPSLLNTLYTDALSVIRATNPTRVVLVGSTYWNQVVGLQVLELPPDPYLIVSVHFYDPFDFTHQGATWLDTVPPSPVNFEPDLVGVGAGWNDWSWGTSIEHDTDSLTATFSRQWQGVAFGRGIPFAPETLTVVLSGVNELAVRCGLAGDVNLDVTTIATTSTPTTFEIDMTSCPDATRTVNFMAISPDSEPLTFFDAELCTTDQECTQLIETGAQSIATAMAAAAAWGQANNRPINLGEFGVFSANGSADINQRALWIELVRSAAESNGLSVTYWDFASGFGVYDPATDTWIEPLLDALGTSRSRIASGDVNCSSSLSTIDALLIAQYAVGLRTAVDSCPLTDPSTQIYLPEADFNRNDTVSTGDALLVAQCVVGNDLFGYCP